MPDAPDTTTAPEATTTGTAATPASPQGQQPNDSAPANGTGNGERSLDGLPPEVQEYIRHLRGENAGYRTERNELRQFKQEVEDRDKTDTQKANERAERAEARAAELEAQTLRAEIAAEKGLSLKQAKRLAGATREELEKDADELLAEFGGNGNGGGQSPQGGQQQQGQGRDWGQGARGTRADGGGSASDQMTAAIRRGMGRA